MAVTIRIPTTLRILTSGEAELDAEEGTVSQIISEVCENYPDFQGRLIDDDGNLLRFVNVYVEDEDVRFLQGLETPVLDGQTISIIPAVAGGR
ncbi:MAG: MoaD/ThiS family protein [Actinomycetota bacterium]|nr:MoaD/ThiS family protein [Actinomycetota bacterium]MED5264804.1 MoaD/ThiS family protein [Actinomycetota bacterium]|tara:strand:+ start:32 stop:310 length:279 start_codon:yes stop_codon:yes gene_type:complete